jgi:putative membrane protein insertion efficiency factor
MSALRFLLRAAYDLPKLALIAAVTAYKLCLSPWLGSSCRFRPTCSSYFIQAVEKYGAVRGSWKGLRRICRCHPFHPGGYDPP